MLPLLRVTACPPLRRRRLTTLQVNLGYRRNVERQRGGGSMPAASRGSSG